MGTGMGTNSYSIIEQGKIDLILSSRPEERRYIFEEASGITKYKSQKKEALRKLEHTENNLVRINDIIQEVRRQINSIERHAKKAERYKNDFEALKGLDLKLATYELRGLNTAIDNNQAVLDELRAEEHELKRELEVLTESINKFRGDLDTIIGELTETQAKRSDAALFIDKGCHRTELNGERTDDLKRIKTDSGEEGVRLNAKIRVQEDEVARITSELNGTVRKMEEKERSLKEKQEKKDSLSKEIDAHQKEQKSAKNRTVDLLAAQTRTKNELIKIGVDLHNRRSRVRRLEMEKENVQGEKRGIEDSLAKAKDELDTCQSKLARRKELLGEQRARLSVREAELESINKRVVEDERKHNVLISKEDVLREMIKNYEGFDKGVKAVMENAKNGTLSGAGTRLIGRFRLLIIAAAQRILLYVMI
jgi:chromosome segregation protein